MAIEYRWAEGQNDRLPALAAELVRRQVAVIVATAARGGACRQGRDDDDSHRLLTGADPVKLGLVASLNRPGGNVTGVSFFAVELVPSGWSCCANWCPKPTRSACWSNPADREYRVRLERRARRRRALWAAAPCPQCQHRTRYRRRLRKLSSNSKSGALFVSADPFFLSSARTTRRAGRPPRAARDLRVARVRRRPAV